MRESDEKKRENAMEECATEREQRRRWLKEIETEEKTDGEGAKEKNDGVDARRRRRKMESARRSRRETEENEGERMVTTSCSERGERRRRDHSERIKFDRIEFD